MGEPGVPKVNEVQGLSTSTTVIAAGNFNAASSIDWSMSARRNLTSIPPIADDDVSTLDGGVFYQTIYSEDSQNSEVGFISYDKDLDVSTANKVSGQYNIQAVKQITYLGVDASSVITNDFLMLDGAGEDYSTSIGELQICPFAPPAEPGIGWAPAFCNRVETGSSMNLKVANLNTQMGDRFVMKSADPGVAIFNNVGVSSYAADLPSKGSVSAFIRGSIKEGGRETTDPETGEIIEWAEDLYETMVFSDSTGVSGDITSFAKAMSYSSVFA
jgi:hypothetical protein